MGLNILKRYFSFSFQSISAKLYEDIAYHGEIQTATCHIKKKKKKKKWHFKNLFFESMGKS